MSIEDDLVFNLIALLRLFARDLINFFFLQIVATRTLTKRGKSVSDFFYEQSAIHARNSSPRKTRDSLCDLILAQSRTSERERQ